MVELFQEMDALAWALWIVPSMLFIGVTSAMRIPIAGLFYPVSYPFILWTLYEAVGVM